jgi:hypothetical protein
MTVTVDIIHRFGFLEPWYSDLSTVASSNRTSWAGIFATFVPYDGSIDWETWRLSKPKAVVSAHNNNNTMPNTTQYLEKVLDYLRVSLCGRKSGRTGRHGAWLLEFSLHWEWMDLQESNLASHACHMSLRLQSCMAERGNLYRPQCPEGHPSGWSSRCQSVEGPGVGIPNSACLSEPQDRHF